MKKLYILLFTLLISAVSFGQIVINEVDADQSGSDTAEFIELLWTPNTALDGFVVVLFNGSDDLSYMSYDLDGKTTDANGFFILANSTAPGYNAATDILLPSNGIQNGADAVAVYQDDGSSFPNDTAMTMTNLIDAVVYGTGDADDAGLLAGLGETTQFNDTGTESIQFDGVSSYITTAPTFRATNNTISCDIVLEADTATCDAKTAGVDTYAVTLTFSGGGTSTYVVTSTSGTVGGDDPSSMATGTITVTNISEGTDITITVEDSGVGGVCNETRIVNSPVCVPSVCANVGDIIITEIMQNPAAVADNMGEYFEVFNTTGAPIDMQGWDIVDLTNSGENFTIASSLIVPSMGYAVIGVNGNTGTNGGVTVDYVYDGTSTFLGNGSDEISIQCSSIVIDEVSWDNGATFPDPNGASMELSTAFLNAASNDVGANWAPAVSALAGGDLGTPGAINDFALSINDFKTNNFKLYPNPTSKGFVNISSNNNAAMKVTVFDVLGKQVINEMVSDKRLDVSNLNTGVYIMRVTQDNASITKKLVIK